MRQIIRIVALAALLSGALPAQAAIRILATTPEWASLARELGGDKVDVYAATTPFQDAHRVEAKPSLIARARQAQLVLATGAQLEVGWLPVLLQEAGNPRVRPGQPGYFEATRQVRLLEVPTSVDRSLGDVHPQGNPHIHLDPRNIATVATALSQRLAQVDPANAAYYQSRGADFQSRWSEAMKRWQERAVSLRGMPVVVIHRDQAYLCNWLGLRELAAIEPKPGVPPSAGYLAQLVARLKDAPPRAILRNAYNDSKAVDWLSNRINAPVVLLPYTVGATPEAKDLFGLFDDTLKRLGGCTVTFDDLSIVWPALIAGVLVVLSHVPMGQQVLARGIVFIDLAIAQVAGLGVIAAHSFGLGEDGWTTQIAAVIAALLGAMLLTWTERKRPDVQEALIGILFVLASTAQILVLANDPHGGEDLKELLAGQILWVSSQQLWHAAILTTLFLIVWYGFRERIGRIGFYVLFALMVTISVQMVGVYLVFTTLIVPAVATYRFAANRQVLVGYLLGILSYVLGLGLSLVTDLPSSSVIVWAMALLGIVVHLASGQRRQT